MKSEIVRHKQPERDDLKAQLALEIQLEDGERILLTIEPADYKHFGSYRCYDILERIRDSVNNSDF